MLSQESCEGSRADSLETKDGSRFEGGKMTQATVILIGTLAFCAVGLLFALANIFGW